MAWSNWARAAASDSRAASTPKNCCLTASVAPKRWITRFAVAPAAWARDWRRSKKRAPPVNRSMLAPSPALSVQGADGADEYVSTCPSWPIVWPRRVGICREAPAETLNDGRNAA